MGLAVATDPAGPYVKSRANPVVPGGHEVLAWPYGNGVVALITTSGERGIINTLQYAEDGVAFRWMADPDAVPSGAGACRPKAFTDSGKGTMIRCGLHIGQRDRYLPFLERYEYSGKQ